MIAAIVAAIGGGFAGRSSADELRRVVDNSIEEFKAAFKQHDARAIAELWTADGEYIDDLGRRFEGREAIETEYAKVFQEVGNASMHIRVDDVRPLGPVMIVEEGRASLLPPPDSRIVAVRYTAIHVLRDGEWKLASVFEAPIEPVGAGRHLADLGWMVGEWQAARDDVAAELNCRQVAGGSVLQVDCSVTRQGKLLATSTELIGWDPQTHRVMSWTFTSTSGRATGKWTPLVGAWLVQRESVSPEGVESSAINLWKRLGDDGLEWSSIRRSLGDAELEDAVEVIFKRK